ncbi:MAG: PKD domain-containing protein [Flavobacteriales bacterium]|nr:PKD domain-containing protein [Flavobacteriales bacterium]
MQFSNATTGTGLSTSWVWSFGDGSTSNDPQPFHTYAQPGTYTVCLTAISILQQPGGGVITCVDSTCAPPSCQGPTTLATASTPTSNSAHRAPTWPFCHR